MNDVMTLIQDKDGRTVRLDAIEGWAPDPAGGSVLVLLRSGTEMRLMMTPQNWSDAIDSARGIHQAQLRQVT